MPPSGTPGSNKTLLIGGALVVVALLLLWFSYSKNTQPSAAELQEKAAQASGDDVAKSENPFQTDNPLSNVKSDPLEKTKEVLNPFETP